MFYILIYKKLIMKLISYLLLTLTVSSSTESAGQNSLDNTDASLTLGDIDEYIQVSDQYLGLSTKEQKQSVANAKKWIKWNKELKKNKKF